MTYTDVLERLDEKGLLVRTENAPVPEHTPMPEDTPVPIPAPVLSGRVQEDSRLVGAGDIFVAVTGLQHNGLDYVDAARRQGAAVVVREAGDADEDISEAPRIAVTNARRALAELASAANGDPGQQLRVAAVTGTNGKTTVATLLAGTLRALGHPTGFVGTTGYRYAGRDVPATHTTPSCVRLYGLLADMLQRGTTHVAVEASSHALDQHRLRVADVDVAVFTNLTRDHLDYHGSEAAYLSAKKRLFDGLSASASAVVNYDDPAAQHITADCKARVVHVGEKLEHPSGIGWHITSSRLDGQDLVIDGRPCRTRLPGRFNAVNVALTYGALTALGARPEEAVGVLETAAPAPGRFETLRLDGARTAVIDYAHTPDALAQILDAVRGVMEAAASAGDAAGETPRLWVVFGCGGDRDRGKRPLMGRVAEERADCVVVTSDNPRFEDPEAIIDDVLSGMQRPGAAVREADRTRAVQQAVRSMRRGDVLVVAGKGHETVQVVGSEALPCDDRHILEGA